MRRRASREAKSRGLGILVVLLWAVLLASTSLFAAGTEAQEVTAGQTTTQTEEATTTVEETQEGAAQPKDTAAETTTKNKNTVAQYRDTSSDEPKQSVQQSSQQAQADPDEDGSEATTRAATTPQGQPAQITESTGDTIVDQITVAVAGCEVDPDAFVVVEDDDGTRVRLTNGQNVTITADNTLTIVGNGADGSFTDLSPNGGDQQFGTESETVTGEVLRSSGITCDRDNGGGNGGGGNSGGNTSGGAGQGGGSCSNAKEVGAVGPTTDNTRTAFTVSGQTFRISYEVDFLGQNDFASVEIDIEDRFGLVDFETIDSSGKGNFIVTEGAGTYDLVVNVEPSKIARYSVTVEDCRKTGVLNAPGGNLPPTGGLSLSVLAGWAALLLVGTALVGMTVRRRR